MLFSCKQVFPSQQYIADSIGYATRRTIIRHLKDLTDLGLLIVEDRGSHKGTFKKKTLIYKIPEGITKDMLQKHSDLFPSFKKKIHTGFPCSKSVIINSGRNVTYINFSLLVNLYKQFSSPFVGVKKSKKDNWVSKNIKINSEIMPLIEKRLCLTTHGRIKLGIFPYEALDFALKALNSSRSQITFEFGFMVKKANEYCKRLNIKVKWSEYFRLRSFYKIPQDDEVFCSQAQAWEEDSPKVVSAVERFGLTYLQKVKLKAFKDSAIDWALKVLNGTPGVINKFAFLIWAANEYCKQYGIKPFWRKSYVLREEYLRKGMTNDISC